MLFWDEGGTLSDITMSFEAESWQKQNSCAQREEDWYCVVEAAVVVKSCEDCSWVVRFRTTPLLLVQLHDSLQDMLLNKCAQQVVAGSNDHSLS